MTAEKKPPIPETRASPEKPEDVFARMPVGQLIERFALATLEHLREAAAESANWNFLDVLANAARQFARSGGETAKAAAQFLMDAFTYATLPNRKVEMALQCAKAAAVYAEVNDPLALELLERARELDAGLAAYSAGKENVKFALISAQTAVTFMQMKAVRERIKSFTPRQHEDARWLLAQAENMSQEQYDA